MVFVLVADIGSEVVRRRGLCYGEEMTLGVKWGGGMVFVRRSRALVPEELVILI